MTREPRSQTGEAANSAATEPGNGLRGRGSTPGAAEAASAGAGAVGASAGAVGAGAGAVGAGAGEEAEDEEDAGRWASTVAVAVASRATSDAISSSRAASVAGVGAGAGAVDVVEADAAEVVDADARGGATSLLGVRRYSKQLAQVSSVKHTLQTMQLHRCIM